ncbi:MAG: hypothetical protein LBC97_05605 [Bifidobacteriaceae bacterium]|jgi:hypothetical protein|nr:hypothetical protein [Bifidobacteriaceae bacterium]
MSPASGAEDADTSRIRNQTWPHKLASVYLRFGLALPALALGALAVRAVTRIQFDEVTQRWVYISGGWKGHTFTTTEGWGPKDMLLWALLVAGGTLIALVATGSRKYDFARDGAPLKSASPRRRTIFWVSVLLGWTGLDRLAMRRLGLGAAKFAAAVAFYACFRIMASWLGQGGSALDTSTAFAGTTGMAVFYWWTADLILVGTGLARQKGKTRLR